MEWLWIAIAMVIAGGGTWLITHFSLDVHVKEFIKNFDKFDPAVRKIITTIIDSLRSDADGTVTLTTDEINAIKTAIAELLALFGVITPF